MKNLLFATALLCAMSLSGAAQISMRQFMKDSNPGETFLKGKYASRGDEPVLGCWMGAVNTNPSRGEKLPLAAEPISWAGYGERDNSIALGSSFPSGVHGQNPLCYGFQRSISTGDLYLSFIVDLQVIRNRKYWTAVGFSNQTWGAQHWCCAVFYPVGTDGDTYNIGIRLHGGLMVVDRIFKTGGKHLIVLKYNFDSNKLAIFIDPDLSKPEPLPDEKVYASIDSKENVVRGLYFRDVSDNVGRIGGFRVARVWEDIR